MWNESHLQSPVLQLFQEERSEQGIHRPRTQKALVQRMVSAVQFQWKQGLSKSTHSQRQSPIIHLPYLQLYYYVNDCFHSSWIVVPDAMSLKKQWWATILDWASVTNCRWWEISLLRPAGRNRMWLNAAQNKIWSCLEFTLAYRSVV